MSNITVSLPDGASRELAPGSTAIDLAAAIGSGLRKSAVAATIDGTESDLTAPLRDGATVALITNDSDEGRHVLRHSTAHVMAQAVTQLFPGAKFSIGPAIENGFYYDFALPGGATFSDDDLEQIEDKMREIVRSNQPFTRSEMSVAEAKELFELFHDLITSTEEPDMENLGKLAVFSGVRNYPTRVKCATLAWHTVRAALENQGNDIVTTEE